MSTPPSSSEVTALLERAAAEAPPVAGGLPHAAVLRGTTLRRRRRVRRAAGSLAVAAALVGGVVMVSADGTGMLSGQGHEERLTGRPPRVAEAPVLERQRPMAEVFTTLVGEYGALSDVRGHENPETVLPGEAFVQATLTDDDGPAYTSAWVTDHRSAIQHVGTFGTGQQADSCVDLDLSGDPGSTCREVAGAVVVVQNVPTYSDERDRGEYCLVVTAFRDGDRVVTITEYNSTHERGGPTRPAPPLTVDQLTDLATDPGWDDARLG
jgi:hypothetical protein